jgi:chaperone required for assembly of F1-ATPase
VKRFYETVTVEELADASGFAIALEGRQIKTPAKALMIAPTRLLADGLAEEWQGQRDKIEPKKMPLNQLLNTAIDRVTAERDNIIDELVRYGGSDMLCYRAGHPDDLVVRQAKAWDPYLDWLRDDLGVSMEVTTGIIHVEQPAGGLRKLYDHISDYNIYTLTTLHAITTGLGSLTMGLAFINAHKDFGKIWTDARVDEAYQVEQWGQDEEAEKATVMLHSELLNAVRFHELVNSPSI